MTNEANADVPSVAAYFQQKLGEVLEQDADPTNEADPSHPEFTIETGCGVECRAAIDAGAEVLNHLRSAFGPLDGDSTEHPCSPPLRAGVVDAIRNVVLCFVYG